ncbi:MAG: FliG C-terminal domain-containing protein [Sedimentitalea sp.]
MRNELTTGLPMAGGLPGDPLDTGAPKPLDKVAKAAIVVRMLLTQGEDLPLEQLPDELQARLTQQMGTMGLVDRDTVDSVIGEFSDILEGVGLTFPKGLAKAISAMDGKISAQTTARLRREAGVRQDGNPWDRLRGVPVEELAATAQSESIEVAAVLLSKLDTGKAAALLGLLPGPLARQITYAISQTVSITPEAIDLIGISLASQLDHKVAAVFADGPDERVGAILNQSPAKTREDVLLGLEEADAEFAGLVRKSMFTFVHIPQRVAPRDVPNVVRAADATVLLTALAGATNIENAPVAEFILSNISNRMSESLREEIAELGEVKAKDGEAAMTEIVNTIRTLQQQEQIELIMPEEEEEN